MKSKEIFGHVILADRVKEEREFYENRLKKASEHKQHNLVNFFEGKVCALLFVEGLLSKVEES